MNNAPFSIFSDPFSQTLVRSAEAREAPGERGGVSKATGRAKLARPVGFSLSSEVRCAERSLAKTVRSLSYLPFFAVFLPAAALVDFFAGAAFFVVAIF